MRLPVAVLAVALALAPPAHAAPRLKAFKSCRQLVAFARDGARRAGGGIGVVPRALPISAPPIATPRPAAPNAAPAPTRTDGASDFSTTNVQEIGVDEPDVVKTDGKRIYAVTDRTLRIVDVTGATPVVRGTLPLAGADQRLLVRGARVLVIASEGAFAVPEIAAGSAETIVTEVDASDPAAPKVARTMTVPGRFVDARQHGGTARLVIDAAPERPQGTALRAFLGRTVLRSRLSGRTFRRRLAPCDAIRRPRRFSGLDVLAILTIDLDRGMYSLDRDGVMAGAQVVYGSAGSLYVASRRYVAAVEEGEAVPSMTTEIHRFDISEPDRTTYAASGSVPGFVLNSYALSEFRGDLRVASTSAPPWGPDAPAATTGVTVLRQAGARLEPIGAVGGLGAGEQVQAVRFLGDKGFVVTFRNTDPLFALDLSDPTAPKLRGTLQLPGYSAYLHPIGDTLLLGVGRNGAHVQASLFDVSDLAAPRRLSQLDLGAGSTPVEQDPHAFLYWPATGLAVLPLETTGFTGAVGLHTAAPLSEVGRVDHQGAPVDRALVIGDRLYTVSYRGLAASRLDTLAPLGFTAFRS